ncbi:hypothetical protein CC78DRAFT_573124 [Lojkania enalia]|uniref:Uncharacterized protein n=1 Tax=Lojkania enalia TaxID=147567 RepID=A0A9P4TRM1_9PLEO|nr:hypothetical protein CC78DRAFT_573124 [Didymosphaeria enalia]
MPRTPRLQTLSKNRQSKRGLSPSYGIPVALVYFYENDASPAKHTGPRGRAAGVIRLIPVVTGHLALAAEPSPQANQRSGKSGWFYDGSPTTSKLLREASNAPVLSRWAGGKKLEGLPPAGPGPRGTTFTSSNVSISNNLVVGSRCLQSPKCWGYQYSVSASRLFHPIRFMGVRSAAPFPEADELSYSLARIAPKPLPSLSVWKAVHRSGRKPARSFTIIPPMAKRFLVRPVMKALRSALKLIFSALAWSALFPIGVKKAHEIVLRQAEELIAA